MAISLGINILLFFPAFFLRTDKLTDFSYSLTFIVLSVIAYVRSPYNPNNLILVSMIIIWAVRLGSFLVARIWTSRQRPPLRRFPQFISRLLKILALTRLCRVDNYDPRLFFISMPEPSTTTLSDLIVFALGFIIESVADYQKFSFKLKPGNKGKFIQSGLWKYSRHPNYFGEMLVWIGVYLFVVFSLTPLQMIIAAISPAFIIMLLVFVSGLPQLEGYADKKWGKQKDYQEYKKRTSILVPWFK